MNIRLARVTDEELLASLRSNICSTNLLTADLLRYLIEVEHRQLHVKRACSSLFYFCTKKLHLSEGAAGRRVEAARAAKRFPVILEGIASGDLTLSSVTMLAKHLTAENHQEVLRRATRKSKREIEQLVAVLAPRPDVRSAVVRMPQKVANGANATATPLAEFQRPLAAGGSDRIPTPCASGDGEAQSALVPAGAEAPRTREVLEEAPRGRPLLCEVQALSPQRYQVRVMIDEATRDKLTQLQDLSAGRGGSCDPAAIIARALDLLLEKTLARKAAVRTRVAPMPTPTAQAASPESATTKSPADERRVENARSKSPAGGRRMEVALSKSPAGGRRAAGRRQIPAAVRREVWARDEGRCVYQAEGGDVCGATRHLEYHHIINVAHGGQDHAGNIELRCWAHNQFQADLDFGRDFMNDKRRKPTHSASLAPSRDEERQLR